MKNYPHGQLSAAADRNGKLLVEEGDIYMIRIAETQAGKVRGLPDELLNRLIDFNHSKIKDMR